MMSKQTVFGVFDKHEDADHAIRDLQSKGYSEKDISIVMKDMEAKETEKKVKGQGASRGATTGAVVGGIAGLVAGFVIPGLGAFFIGGPIASALGLAGVAATGATGIVTGAVGGGILGALTGYGVSRRDAQEYERRIQEGSILVAVPVRMDQEKEVEQILANYHADSIQTVEMPEQEEKHFQDRPEQYAQPSGHEYMGAKGGKAEKSKKK